MLWFPAENALTGILAFALATTGQTESPPPDPGSSALAWHGRTRRTPARRDPSNPVGPVGAEQDLIAISVWAALFLAASLISVMGRIDVRE
jgi:hypothetical protein